jgi:hypothetical protein
MYKRKQYIIDKKFQIRTTFLVIAIVTLITSLILIAFTANVVYNNTRIENIYEIEDNIVHFLTTPSVIKDDKAYKQAQREISVKHSNNMHALESIMQYNRKLLIIMVAIIIIQGLALYMILIKKTHQVSGPIYVISRYMNEIIEGKLPDIRPLRKSDELKDFYDLFGKMIKTLKEKEKLKKK